jgi:hypothetical protein
MIIASPLPELIRRIAREFEGWWPEELRKRNSDRDEFQFLPRFR